MKLTNLFDGTTSTSLTNSSESPEISIEGITTDPSLCRPGFLYVAAECETVDSKRFGVRLDGREFIQQAIQNGAAAVLTDTKFAASQAMPQHVRLITHDQPLRILGPICSNFFNKVAPKTIAIVTGTNGKTSTVNFCRALWHLNGLPACSLGNLGGVCSDGTMIWERDPTLSVPETVALHQMFNSLAARGIDHVAMEATSHALFDYRLNGVPASIAAFTNLTRDHLDFHITMEEYFRVKMMLFEEVLDSGSTAVLNADSPWFDRARDLSQKKRHQIISYGRMGTDVRLVDSKVCTNGQQLTLNVFGKEYECALNLFGEFQASNVLCSLAIVIASGVAQDKAVSLIQNLGEVEGRLNLVAETPSGGKVIVDYAHSPDGIRAALEACRTFTKGRLFIIFACNGERDAGKRPEMGKIASKLADAVIVTDGHPRTEDPSRIRKEVLAGAPGAREITGRAAAIETVMSELQSGDTLLIAGMGHEKFQAIGGKRIPYSDQETVLSAVAKLKNEEIAQI